MKLRLEPAGGGTLSFYVNGTKLDFIVEDVYSLLGGNELFPCVSLCPLDPLTPEQTAAVAKAQQLKMEERKKKQESGGAEETEEGEETEVDDAEGENAEDGQY